MLQFIEVLLKQNLEFRLILEKGEAFPSRHFFDPTVWFQKISLEGNWLEAEEFLNLAYGVEAIIACKVFLTKNCGSVSSTFSSHAIYSDYNSIGYPDFFKDR